MPAPIHTRADVNEARPLDWRPHRCAPCQPDGLGPTAHWTRHDPSATSARRTDKRDSADTGRHA